MSVSWQKHKRRASITIYNRKTSNQIYNRKTSNQIILYKTSASSTKLATIKDFIWMGESSYLVCREEAMCNEVRKNTHKKHRNSIVVQLLLRLQCKVIVFILIRFIKVTNDKVEIKLWNVYKMRLTLNQKMPTAPVAAQTPIFPRNNTKSPTLLMAATRRTLLTKVMKAWKIKVPNLVYQNLH